MGEQEIRNTLGANIRKYRRQLKFSQEILSEKIDIATNFLSDIETGRKWVSPATLAKLSDALEVEAWQLFKPEGALPAEVVELLTRFTGEALIKVDKSIGTLCKQYASLLETTQDLRKSG